MTIKLIDYQLDKSRSGKFLVRTVSSYGRINYIYTDVKNGKPDIHNQTITHISNEEISD